MNAVKTHGKLVKVNGSTVGYVSKEGSNWIVREFMHKAGLVVSGETKQSAAEDYCRKWLA